MNRLQVLCNDGKHLRNIENAALPFRHPAGFGFDSSGNIFVADWGRENGCVQVLNYTNGTYVHTMCLWFRRDHESLFAMRPMSLVLGHGGCIITCDPTGVVFLDEIHYVQDQSAPSTSDKTAKHSPPSSNGKVEVS